MQITKWTVSCISILSFKSRKSHWKLPISRFSLNIYGNFIPAMKIVLRDWYGFYFWFSFRKRNSSGIILINFAFVQDLFALSLADTKLVTVTYPCKDKTLKRDLLLVQTFYQISSFFCSSCFDKLCRK